LELAMQHQAETALNAVSQQQLGFSGRVRIRATEGVALLLLPHAIARIGQQYPNLAIQVEVTNADEDSLPPAIDIAIAMHKPARAGVIRKQVAKWPLEFFCHKEIIGKRPPPNSLEKTKEMPWIGFDKSNQLKTLFKQLGQSRNYPARMVLHTDSSMLRWQALRTGLGIGVFPTWLAASDLNIKSLNLGVTLPAMEVWLVTHPGLALSPAIKAVFDAISVALSAPKSYGM
jgi:DNA-binding transcriptional LysR family regulator